MAGRGLPPERVEAVLGYLAAGLNPMQAARAAGVSRNSAYRLDLKVGGAFSALRQRSGANHRTLGRVYRATAHRW